MQLTPARYLRTFLTDPLAVPTVMVLLPGVTTLARLVAGVREEATDRLHQTLFDLLTPAQRMILELTVEAAGARYSDLER